MRLVIGDPLAQEEYEAILYESGEQRYKRVDSYLDKLLGILEGDDNTATRLQILSYLVLSERLEIKFALRPHGMYHEKIGIIYDNFDNCIVFQGSANETPSALLEHLNAECISVYKSWDEQIFLNYGHPYIDAFNELWEGKQRDTIVLDVLSEQYKILASKIDKNFEKKKIQRFDYEKLLQELDYEQEQYIEKTNINLPFAPKHFAGKKFEIRDHQRSALKAWHSNGFKGILKHATGSGKTITALFAITRIFEAKSRKDEPLIVIISVPYIDLAQQWQKELRNFNIIPIECYESRDKWQKKLQLQLQLFHSGGLEFLCLLVVNKTLVSENFQEAIKSIPKHSLFFIGDECHRHGNSKTVEALPEADFKLGLSATPFIDNDINEELESAFENEPRQNIESYYQKVVHEYNLEDAIIDGVLTPYDYHIVPVHLTMDEQQTYDDLSEKINKIIVQSNGKLNQEQKSILLTYSSKRSRLLGSAKNKLSELRRITKNTEESHRQYSLFYVGEGKDDTDQQVINQVTKVLNENKWKVAHFTGETTKDDRNTILSAFKNGSIESLIAMKVLDEGIDVPACRTAYILASSKNPRQYVQRRGRVLRKFDGKEKAVIYDFVILPCKEYSSIYGTKLVDSELIRIRDFTALATNKCDIENIIDNLEKMNDK